MNASLSTTAKTLLTYLPPESNPFGAPLVLLADDMCLPSAEALQPAIRELRDAGYELRLNRSGGGDWCLSVKACCWARVQQVAGRFYKQLENGEASDV